MQLTRKRLVEIIKEEINKHFGTDLSKQDIEPDISISDFEDFSSWVKNEGVSRVSVEYTGGNWIVKLYAGPGVSVDGTGKDLVSAIFDAIGEYKKSITEGTKP